MRFGKMVIAGCFIIVLSLSMGCDLGETELDGAVELTVEGEPYQVSSGPEDILEEPIGFFPEEEGEENVIYAVSPSIEHEEVEKVLDQIVDVIEDPDNDELEDVETGKYAFITVDEQIDEPGTYDNGVLLFIDVEDEQNFEIIVAEDDEDDEDVELEIEITEFGEVEEYVEGTFDGRGIGLVISEGAREDPKNIDEIKGEFLVRRKE